jgi:hypothetical protein
LWFEPILPSVRSFPSLGAVAALVNKRTRNLQHQKIPTRRRLDIFLFWWSRIVTTTWRNRSVQIAVPFPFQPGVAAVSTVVTIIVARIWLSLSSPAGLEPVGARVRRRRKQEYSQRREQEQKYQQRHR